MIRPNLLAGIEESGELPGLRIKSSNVRPFCSVALGTSPTEVVRFGGTVVFPGADVIDFVGQDRTTLRHVTVFAPVVSALTRKIADVSHARLLCQGGSCFCLEEIQKLANPEVFIQISLFNG